MMSQRACSEAGLPRPILISEGLRLTQNGHDDIERIGKQRKRVRFRMEAPNNPVEPSCSEEDVELQVISWNIHNQNPYTFRKRFLEMETHVWIIQEGNKAIRDGEKQLGYRWFTKGRNDKQLLIGIIPKIQGRRRLDLETPNSLVIEIFIGNCQILIGNIHQTEWKGEYKIILEKLENQFSIIGADLNSKPRREISRFDIVSDLVTRIRKKGRMEFKNNKLDFGSKIDFIFINKGIRIHQKQPTKFQEFEDKTLISDHKPLKTIIKLKRNDSMVYPVLNAKEARGHFCKWMRKEERWKLKEEYEQMDIVELLRETTKLKPEDNMIQFRTPKYQEWNEEFQQKIKVMERCERGKYHKFIQHTSQIRAEKEGGIVNILNIDGKIVTCYKEILHQCIEKMKGVSGTLEENEIRPWSGQMRIGKNTKNNSIFNSAMFDELLEMEGETIERFNRAISFDFIHLTPVRLVMKNFHLKNGDIDWNILDLEKWKANEFCMAQRLIPLNKVAPKIAGVDDIRPIMVQSHLVKFVEWSYAKALKDINGMCLDPCQVGFTSKLGTQILINKVVDKMKSRINSKNFTFFDLSNAYNTVDREILYRMLTMEEVEESKWLDKEKIDFLFNMYDQLYVFDPITKEKVRFRNGVQQGSSLSPFLFNIFFNAVLRTVKEEIEIAKDEMPKKNKRLKKYLEEVEIWAYADDVVIYSKKEVAHICANAFIKVAESLRLKVNLKKTKYLGNKQVQKLEEIGIQRVETFRYLGTWLSVRGGMKEQIKRTKGIVAMKAQKLGMLKKVIPFRSLAKLWVLYVLPHIRYHNLAIWQQKKSIINKWQIIKRNSFRKTIGLNKNFPKNILDGMIGRLEYDFKEEGYLRKQLRIQLFREKVFEKYPEWFTWRNVIQLYNFFLWNQFHQEEMKMFGLEEADMEIYKGLMDTLWESNAQFTEGLDILEQNWKALELKEGDPFWTDKNEVPRGVQAQVIRRIPGYTFFEPYKHSWRVCKTHKRNMTSEHILNEHLHGEPGNWQEKFEKIQKHIMDYIKSFYTRVQKSMQKKADKWAERIRKLIGMECEPYSKLRQKATK